MKSMNTFCAIVYKKHIITSIKVLSKYFSNKDFETSGLFNFDAAKTVIDQIVLPIIFFVPNNVVNQEKDASETTN